MTVDELNTEAARLKALVLALKEEQMQVATQISVELTKQRLAGRLQREADNSGVKIQVVDDAGHVNQTIIPAAGASQ